MLQNSKDNRQDFSDFVNSCIISISNMNIEDT